MPQQLLVEAYIGQAGRLEVDRESRVVRGLVLREDVPRVRVARVVRDRERDDQRRRGATGPPGAPLRR